jgi:hypothetical protein
MKLRSTVLALGPGREGGVWCVSIIITTEQANEKIGAGV